MFFDEKANQGASEAKKKIIKRSWKKQCMYCNSYVRQNLRVRCSLNFEFGTYDVIKCIFILFNVNKVTQHVNCICLLFWKFLLHTSIFNALELITKI